MFSQCEGKNDYGTNSQAPFSDLEPEWSHHVLVEREKLSKESQILHRAKVNVPNCVNAAGELWLER